MSEPRIFHDGKVVLHAGDCLEVLDTLEENSVDSVASDPPYHLTSIVKRFGGTNAAPAQGSSSLGGAYARGSAGFMGKQWDGGDIAFRPETWAKVLRVLKPGGHLVAFAAPKCAHRMICAIEDAGFEIRDGLLDLFSQQLVEDAFFDSLSLPQRDALLRMLDGCDSLANLFWAFGTGFPKSLDVSKGIEKKRDDYADVVRVTSFVRAGRDRAGKSNLDIDAKFGTCGMAGHWTTRASQPAVPNWEQWQQLKAFLDLPSDMDAEVWRLNGRKGQPGEAWALRDVTGTVEEWNDRSNYALTSRDGLRRDNPATEEGLAWRGWGTALKPAYEPICLARKPIAEASVAANVLRYGTGAINVDACRVGEQQSGGRWPANIIHDGSREVVAAFPAEAGTGGAATRPSLRGVNNSVARGRFNGLPDDRQPAFHADSGSAARFFYSAKADADDRLGSKHPTVKPVDLMQWLVRLITPPGGTVLDPFAGSGSTGVAALREGFRAILIEREQEYRIDIARKIDLAFAGSVERKSEVARIKGTSTDDLPLFGGAA